MTTTPEIDREKLLAGLYAYADAQDAQAAEVTDEPEVEVEPVVEAELVGEPEAAPVPEQTRKAAAPHGEGAKPAAGKGKGRGSLQGAVAASDAFLVEQIASECLAGRFCWSPHLGWMRWDDRVWAHADDATVRDEVRRYLAEWVIGQITRPTAGVGYEDLLKLLTKGRIGGLTDLARGLDDVLVNGQDFDADPDVITVENGIVDLRTSALMPHDPGRYLTRYVPTRFVPGAQHADVDAMLSAVAPDVADWLQLRMGQGITGHVPDDDLMLLLHGDGKNGKSSLVDGLCLALGGRTDTGAMTFLDDSVLCGDRDAKEERMALKGARLAFAEELPEGRRLNVTQLKKAVGTAVMKARHLYQREVLWETSHTLFITTNYRPTVAETDHGTWRRLALVPFPYTFVREPAADFERQGDSGLKRRLAGQAQREAVLAWLIAGARRWYATDRSMPDHPAAVQEATHRWRAESDVIMRYWGERLVADYDSHVMSKELMEDLNKFLGEIGQQSWSQKTAADRFGAHEETKTRKVEKALIRHRDGLSRPTTDVGHGWVTARPEPPARYHAWVGVRFAGDADLTL
ncbi:phage/plasmid primase, P4 family [Streptomyces sp. NBC_00989]|uniref:DNA primase family protein n=1 Tax=Streptomyces sp. NBC_00989 TaxID=2903705 RepID=UPI00386AC245|nr:phage/plasmid primase, P4 family [Streptomyces sp. NBC_00989]